MNDQHIDDEVAKLTDAVLENRMGQASEDSQEYEPVIRRLKAMIEPESAAPDAFRQRLTQRLNDEWMMSRRARAPQSRLFSSRLFSSRPMRLATLAASVAVVLLAVILLLNNCNPNTTDVSPGTSVGGEAIFAIVALIGGVIAFALLRGKR